MGGDHLPRDACRASKPHRRAMMRPRRSWQAAVRGNRRTPRGAKVMRGGHPMLLQEALWPSSLLRLRVAGHAHKNTTGWALTWGITRDASNHVDDSCTSSNFSALRVRKTAPIGTHLAGDATGVQRSLLGMPTVEATNRRGKPSLCASWVHAGRCSSLDGRIYHPFLSSPQALHQSLQNDMFKRRPFVVEPYEWGLPGHSQFPWLGLAQQQD